jgi:hypothetical protein
MQHQDAYSGKKPHHPITSTAPTAAAGMFGLSTQSCSWCTAVAQALATPATAAAAGTAAAQWPELLLLALLQLSGQNCR